MPAKICSQAIIWWLLRLGGKTCSVPACLLLSACSGASPAVPSFFNGAPALAPVKISATDAYSRIARGANACWLGEGGPLYGKYTFYAEAEPDSKGGAAGIRIYERGGDGRPAAKAYGVAIAPGSEHASVSSQNVTLQTEIAKRMDADVERWAGGGVGCDNANGSTWFASPQDSAVVPASTQPPKAAARTNGPG